jgi:hypothetical protein
VEGVAGAVLYRQDLLQRKVSSPAPALTAALPSPNLTPDPSVKTTATPSLAPPKAHSPFPDLVSIFDAVRRALEQAGSP